MNSLALEPVEITLTRNHYARLRLYWKAGLKGLTTTGDGVALSLTAGGYLEMINPGGGQKLALRITASGITELHEELEREKSRRKPHHNMADRLASWLQSQGQITWCNIELLVDLASGGRQAIRPDVFAMETTYDEKRLNPCVYEVKVSRADFRADVAKPEKRSGYGQIAERVYYVVPAGLIELAEVPPECGLVVERSEGAFEVLRRPKKQRVKLTVHHFMNLILKPGSVNPIDAIA